MDSNHFSPLRKGMVGVQFLFMASGATVLVSLLVGLDSSVALFTAGVGTLLFHLITKGKVPISLGSSFAFITPIIKATELYGLAGTLSGMVEVALAYFAMSALVKWQGIRLTERLFSPVVIGPVIILIGPSFVGTRVSMARESWILTLLSLLTAVVVSIRVRGLLKLIPILCGIIVGYVVALALYDVNPSRVRDAAWLGFSQFVFPEFPWEPILFMMPVAIVLVVEYTGDMYVVNTVTGEDYMKDPGLHRTLLGDGLACLCAGLLGDSPVTTYSEVTGAMLLTRVTNPQAIRVTTVTTILLSVIGKVSALLKSIPSAILGGIILLLFGTIACAGIANLVNSCIDLSRTHNIIVVSLTSAIGIDGAVLTWGELSLSGIGLAVLVGAELSLVFPREER